MGVCRGLSGFVGDALPGSPTGRGRARWVTRAAGCGVPGDVSGMSGFFDKKVVIGELNTGRVRKHPDIPDTPMVTTHTHPGTPGYTCGGMRPAAFPDPTAAATAGSGWGRDRPLRRRGGRTSSLQNCSPSLGRRFGQPAGVSHETCRGHPHLRPPSRVRLPSWRYRRRRRRLTRTAIDSVLGSGSIAPSPWDASCS